MRLMYFSECQKDVLTSNQYKTYYQAKPFYAADGVFELLIRFKGIADGHVILTSNATSEEPRYTVSIFNVIITNKIDINVIFMLITHFEFIRSVLAHTTTVSLKFDATNPTR